MSVQTPSYDVQQHAVVSHEDWVSARKALLAEEKAFTRERDRISQLRRNLPWERVEKSYAFEGTEGKRTLAELFGERSQLAVYHFMFGADWDAGCKSCSFWADNFDHIPPHLRARDVSFVAVSNAPLDNLLAYQKRMGWSFPWYSSYGSDFNYDYAVSFTQEEVDGGNAWYNYGNFSFPDTEGPGASVFYKNADGTLFHTYSTFGRGIDILNGAYNWLDLMPKGRDENGEGPVWLRRRDEYGT